MTDREPRREGDDHGPEDEFRELLSALFAGVGGGDVSQLARTAGVDLDAAGLRAFAEQLQAALRDPNASLSNEQVREAAVRAAGTTRALSAEEVSRYAQALRIADLWLGDSTTIGELIEAPRTMTRIEWIDASMSAWIEIARPVAESIASKISEVVHEQLAAGLGPAAAQAERMIRAIANTMFALQLGQALGRIAAEAVSGSDIGMPVLRRGLAVLLPQNVEEFGRDLGIDPGEIELYLSVRELAHAKLFQHAKWLQLHLEAAIRDFGRGISTDASTIEEVVRDIDVNDPSQLRDVLASGKLIPPLTPQQQDALDRLETVLALIEGWVDVVTRDATKRLPSSDALAEMMRRRRATGGPAEHAFGTLVGLQIHPRRLREAAALWQTVGDALGAPARDALWDYQDALPSSEDIDDPAKLVERLRAGSSDGDEIDSDLRRLLDDPGSFGDAPDGGDAVDNDGDR